MGIGAIIGTIFGVIVLLILIVGFWFFGIYNGLIQLRNATKNAWSNIDVQLKRRHDLIPNIVETVKGYAAHERQTLEAVTQARNIAVGSVGKGVDKQIQAEAGLSGALAKLFAVAEQYPNLKANENFLALQSQLAETENALSFARQVYNEAVLNLNNMIQMFPSNIVAGMFRFTLGTFFEITSPEEKETPKVKF
jgi:LemA protein